MTESRIAEILKPYNSQNPLKRDELLLRLKDSGINICDREMRDIVARMVIDGNYPIGTTTEGYFCIITEEDLKKAVSELEKKSLAIAVRKNCLKRNFYAKVLNQGTLFEM